LSRTTGSKGIEQLEARFKVSIIESRDDPNGALGTRGCPGEHYESGEDAANCSLIQLPLRDPFNCETNQLNGISKTQFLFDVRTMRFDGLYAQVKFGSDVLGSKPASEQLDYFKFSFGEPV
jgi:hypothetical protein